MRRDGKLLLPKIQHRCSRAGMALRQLERTHFYLSSYAIPGVLLQLHLQNSYQSLTQPIPDLMAKRQPPHLQYNSEHLLLRNASRPSRSIYRMTYDVNLT